MIIRRVVGPSMEPTMKSGDIIVAIKIKPKDLQIGDIVVVRYRGKDLIKRVTKISDGFISILGDNRSSSNDSRNFGVLPIKSAKWRVFLIWPKAALWPHAVARFE